MKRKTARPDVESAMECARDLIRGAGLEPTAAIAQSAEDWDVKVEVLRARFERAYGITPEQMFAKVHQVVRATPTRRTVHSSNPIVRIEQKRKNVSFSSELQQKSGEPIPVNFGLPHNFDFDQHRQDMRIIRRKASIGVVLFCASVVTVLVWPTHIWPIFAFFLLVVTPYITNNLLNLLNVLPRLTAEHRQVIAYEEAHANWVLTQTERGALYWQGLNGLDFERAVHSLFVRRGCDATLTKGSGDGGIDIRLTIGNQEYSCQCKAHRKPIGVATIRQIVGSCVHLGGSPVVIATNGFTKPALQIASDLNVVCLSTPDLCKLAGNDRILQIN